MTEPRTFYQDDWRGRVYSNLEPHARHGLSDVLRWQLGLGPDETPRHPLLQSHSEPRYAQASPLPLRPLSERLRITWIGHSSFLIQHGGRNILTDPIFGNCQPYLPLRRLRRAVPPGIPLDALPVIHDVLVSHNHYDHLDAPTVSALARCHHPHFWLPAGLGRWFQKRRLSPWTELEWGQGSNLSESIRIESVPAQHFAGRGLFDRNRAHWCGWVLQSPSRSLYFVGDSGYSSSFRALGKKWGGFDVSLIPIGAYRPRWLMQPMHVDPREAVQIHIDVRSRLSVACHWGTFPLTDEPLNEPPRMLAWACTERRLPVHEFLVLNPGAAIEV